MRRSHTACWHRTARADHRHSRSTRCFQKRWHEFTHTCKPGLYPQAGYPRASPPDSVYFFEPDYCTAVSFPKLQMCVTSQTRPGRAERAPKGAPDRALFNSAPPAPFRSLAIFLQFLGVEFADPLFTPLLPSLSLQLFLNPPRRLNLTCEGSRSLSTPSSPTCPLPSVSSIFSHTSSASP